MAAEVEIRRTSAKQFEGEAVLLVQHRSKLEAHAPRPSGHPTHSRDAPIVMTREIKARISALIFSGARGTVYRYDSRFESWLGCA